MSNLSFQWETVASTLEAGLEDLIALHWEEVALNKDAVPLSPDWSKYHLLERAGVLKVVGARLGKRLIGYDIFFVQPTMHYSSCLWAVNDILYLDPDHRKGLAGARLIRESEKMLKPLGVTKVIYHTKLHVHLGHGKARDTVGGLLKRLGYAHVEEVYAKMI
jgi:GNAT superfamily N-acetyltransferase